jgi:hypothetical protein
MRDARKACDRSSRRRARSIITTYVWCCSFSSQTSVSAAKASYASSTYYTPPKSMQRESSFSCPRGCYTRDPWELSNVDSNDGGKAHAPFFLSACSNNESGRDMTTANHAPTKTNSKTKQTHFLSVRSHAPERQVHEFPASPPRATPRLALALAPRGAFLFWLN